MLYPPARRQDVVEVLHGVSVPDPYRWLEDGASPEVRAWTAAQHALTRSVLDAVPGRDAIHRRVTELLAVGTLFPPEVRRGRYFYIRRDRADAQPLLYWRQGVRGVDQVLVDPVADAKEVTAAIDWWFPSPDGRRVAYGISRRGDEQSVLAVRDVDTGRDHPEHIPRTRLCSLAWLPDGSGFYYTRFPLPGTVPPGDEEYGRRVFLHRIDTDWQEDPEIFGAGRPKEHSAWLDLSPDGRWLWVGFWHSATRNDLYLLDRRRADADFVAVAEGIDAVFFPDVHDDALYVRTNLDAPRYRICRVDPERPQRSSWVEVIPEGPDAIQSHAVVGGHVVSVVLRKASSAMRVHRLEGTLAREVSLPGLGTIYWWTGRADQDDVFIGFLSFGTAPTVIRHTLSTGAQERWEALAPAVDPGRLEVRQVWYRSKDGTAVSMFLVHEKGLRPDGDRPTVLHGYGGFNAAMTPFFVQGAHVLLERGGVMAAVNLRGGGEYGEAWHRAGMLERKQNVFDDCIAAAEWLIAEGYTRPERLGILGTSNGGLLVGAVVTQRPDLLRAAVCRVPLLDMLRYHRFNWANSWRTELGSSDDPEQSRYLLAYSPYHRVQDGVRYPAMLVTASEADSRCEPLHARKFIARVQAATAGASPILLRVQADAGHGPGTPIGTLVEEVTDIWCFLLSELGLA